MSFVKNLAASLLIAPAAALAAPAIRNLPPTATVLQTPVAELARAQSALELSLPRGRSLRFATQVAFNKTGMVGVRGASAAGDRLSMYVAGGRVLSADIHASGGRYRLVSHGGREYWIQEDRLTHVALGEFEPGFPLSDAAPPVFHGKAAVGATPRAEPGADGVYEIDVLAAYTPTFQARYGSRKAVAEETQRLLFLANTYLANSEVPVRYRLVGAELYTGTSESADFFANLATMATDPGVTQLRDGSGADIVMMMRTMDGETGVCGLSAGFNGMEKTDPPQNVVPERDGLLIAGMGPSADGHRCPDFVLAHELGHNLAAGHDFFAAPGSFYWKTYSHAWVCGIAGVAPPAQVETWSSIMYAGANNLVNLNDSIRLGMPRGDFFSNPALSRDSMPCGLDGVPGTDATEANNSRAMTEAGPYVAAYRQSKLASAPATAPEGVMGGGGLALLSVGMLLVAALRRRGRA